MKILHFWAHHAIFGANKNLFWKTIHIIFMHLLTLFIVENFLKIFAADLELQGCVFFKLKMSSLCNVELMHFGCAPWPTSLCKSKSKLLEQI